MKTSLNPGEIVAGLLAAAIGVVAIVIAQDYSFGTITRMGPGFVPIMLGALLVMLGLAAAFMGRHLPRAPLGTALRPTVLILGGILAWVLMVDRFGFVPATLALVAIAAQAERDITLLETAILALALAAGGYILFIRGLHIPIAAFGS